MPTLGANDADPDDDPRQRIEDLRRAKRRFQFERKRAFFEAGFRYDLGGAHTQVGEERIDGIIRHAAGARELLEIPPPTLLWVRSADPSSTAAPLAERLSARSP